MACLEWSMEFLRNTEMGLEYKKDRVGQAMGQAFDFPLGTVSGNISLIRWIS